MEQGFKKIIDDGHKECFDCKEIHFIPEGKIRCLPCAGKFIKQERAKEKGTFYEIL